jgi:GNAT superfamily N-acetyltransferase
MENALKPGTPARFFICYEEDQAVACCVLNIGSGIEAGGDYIWINEFHVREDKRRQGIGKALLKHVLQWAKEEGYEYIASVTSPSNQAARELFKHQGFDDSEMIWLCK